MLLLVSGCSAAPEIDLAIAEATKSVVLIVQRSSASGCEHILSAEAFDAPNSAHRITVPTGAGDDPLTVSVALLPASLSALGLSPDPLASGAIAGGRCAIPEGTKLMRAEIRDRRAGSFQTVSDPGPLAACVCIPVPPAPPAKCWDFRAEEIPLEESTTAGATFVLPLDDRTVLVGTPDSGHLFRVSVGTSSASVESIAPLPDGFPLWQAIRRDDGSMIFSGYGEIWSATLGPPFTAQRIATSTPADQLAWLDGLRSATAPPDLFVLGLRGRWLRYQGGVGFTVLTEFPAGSILGGGSLRLGAEEAIAVYGTSAMLAHLRGGAVSFEPIGDATGDVFTAAAMIPGFGAVLGTARAALFIERDGSWARAADAGLTKDPVRAIAAYEDGMVFTGHGAFLAQYHPDGSLCPAQFSGDFQANGLAVLGRDVLLAGDRGTNPQTTLFLMRRK